ncbi:hypothetical protein [Actinomadura formosensis]|uniref:hypothetical protein n=1 Tax=Actinomadura formosensis TaxID=60706 RepID=UPI000830CB90|nr:hypothetical protein [Actinomadura formosensis]
MTTDHTGPSGRWTLYHLHHTVMGGLTITQRIVLLGEHDEHLAALEQLREDAARIGYRLNAVAPAAEPGTAGDFRFPGMEPAIKSLTEAAEHRWAQINQGGRLEDPALWAPDRERDRAT